MISIQPGHHGQKLSRAWRALGLAPLLILAYSIAYWGSRGRWAELLWMCDVANLILGVGLLFSFPALVWIATLLLIPAAPLWIWDLSVLKGEYWTMNGFLLHIGSMAIGILGVRGTAQANQAQSDGKKRRLWWKALLVLVVVQLITRLVTPPEPNINVAHRVYEGLEGIFSSYAMFWVSSFLCFAALYYLLEIFLDRWVRRPLCTKKVKLP